jgi:hypothetical protein
MFLEKIFYLGYCVFLGDFLTCHKDVFVSRIKFLVSGVTRAVAVEFVYAVFSGL